MRNERGELIMMTKMGLVEDEGGMSRSEERMRSV
jgi:hypothetical protein